MQLRKPSRFWYRITQFAAGTVSKYLFRPRLLRNEIKGKKGPFVIIANHQAALDFINLIGATREPMHFVISDCFYNTLPLRGAMDKIGVIPKQQFQTTLTDMKLMRSALDQGRPLVIYPAGLMCEDGLSTPLPQATFQFLKWTRADIYVARTQGTYLAKPKWARKARPGRTYLDIYRLFTKEELHDADLDTVKARTEEALLFDAYREQETLRVRYRHGDNVEGLQHVLYQCPHCKKEFTVQVKDKNTLCCEACGFEQTADAYGFLHNEKGVGKELRYVSDWSREIYADLKQRIQDGVEKEISCHATIRMIDYKKCKFRDAGEASITLTEGGFELTGSVNGEPLSLHVPICTFASLPFGPGRHFDIQCGKDIYRCCPDDGRMVMKLINFIKIFYELNCAEHEHDRCHCHCHEQHE